MKHLFSSLCLALAAAAFVASPSASHAQELNCQVEVIAPQISNIEASIFEGLEERIAEFINGRKWTSDNFRLEERIECTIQITISDAPSPTSFKGNIQVQSSRPVYNSDYKTPMLLVNDNDFEIIWDGTSTIQFSPGQHRDNLSSILAYYAYMILGMDYDSMALDGGTDFYVQAQTIVANAQSTGSSGWKAGQNQQNRYWLVENMLSQTFKPVRNCLYNYHRLGLDRLYDDLERGRLNMADALIEMRATHRIRPSSYNLQLFFLAKSDEILKVFSPAPDVEKTRLLPVLKQMDPGNISKYDSILG